MKPIIFDMDGVIIDSERVRCEAWVEIGAEYALGADDLRETYARCIGTTEEATIEIFRDHFGADIPVMEFREKVLARLEGVIMPIKPGVRELLSWLHEHKVQTALASSSYSDVIEETLTAHRLTEYFNEIISGEMVQNSKPEPDIFLAAARRLAAAPDSCLAIEDSYNGIRAASRAGMPVWMVPDMLPPTDEMRQLADRILDDLAAVRTALEEELCSEI